MINEIRSQINCLFMRIALLIHFLEHLTMGASRTAKEIQHKKTRNRNKLDFWLYIERCVYV